MPTATAPGDCGPNCGPKATRGVLRLALLAAPSGPARAKHPSATAPHHRGRPGGCHSQKPAAWSARAHRSQSGVGGQQHVLTPSGRALVLPGHLARCLLPAGHGLAPGRANAHRTLAYRPRKGLDPAPARPGLIIHADRGSQCISAACCARIDQAEALPSFSRPGNPYDNAQAEAGWSTLETELLPHGTAFPSLEEARLEVAHVPAQF